jgi:glycerol-3-phosphate dehydrogenase
VVVNATGPFTDNVRKLEHADAAPMIAPSQGVHVVLDRSFLPGESAIMVPHTDDGRVMFAIPWHDVAIVGTTDTPVDRVDLEPVPRPDEVAFILDTANRYLARPASAGDVCSVFAGIRPLVKLGDGKDTAALSRDHTILIDPQSGLLTVAGGKWTTYRKMAEDVVDHAITFGDLGRRKCVTRRLPIHGAQMERVEGEPVENGPLSFYGANARQIEELVAADASLGERLHSQLAITRAEVVWACRREMARTVDDVLARRTRSLLLDARAAIEAAPAAAEIMAAELGRDDAWAQQQVNEFRQAAEHYVHVVS